MMAGVGCCLSIATGILILVLGGHYLGGMDELWQALPRGHRTAFDNFAADPAFPSVGITWQDGIANTAMLYFLVAFVLAAAVAVETYFQNWRWPWMALVAVGGATLLSIVLMAMATLPAPGYALDPVTGVPTAELLPPEKFHCFGDWLHIDDETPKEVIYTAYFAQSTRLLGRAARALGKDDEAWLLPDTRGYALQDIPELRELMLDPNVQFMLGNVLVDIFALPDPVFLVCPFRDRDAERRQRLLIRAAVQDFRIGQGTVKVKYESRDHALHLPCLGANYNIFRCSVPSGFMTALLSSASRSASAAAASVPVG